MARAQFKKLNRQSFNPVTRPPNSHDARDTSTNAPHQSQSSPQQPTGPTNPTNLTNPTNQRQQNTRVTFSPDTPQYEQSTERLRSPPLFKHPSDEALPRFLSDDLPHAQGIPLKLVQARNSLFVHDTGNDIHFLVDTGAERSLMPVDYNKTGNVYEKDPFCYLIAANGSRIHTYGEQQITLTFSPNHKYNWTFILANIEEPILGADFLKKYGLLVDIASKQLIDRQRDRINTVNIPEPFPSIIQRFPNLTTINPRSPTNDDTHHF